MTSIEMTKEGYSGIPADVDAATEDDLRQVCESKDIQMLPLLISQLKGLRATVAAIAVTVAPDSKTLKVGDTLVLTAARTPERSGVDVVWTSGTVATATVTVDPDDSRKATVKALATGSSTITATCGANITDTCSITVS